MEVVPLTLYPNYCKQLSKMLFKEWSDNYIKYSPWHSAELLQTNYLEKQNKRINTFILRNKSSKKLIGCFTLNTSFFKLYLYDVFIVPSYRRNKFGSKLLKMAIDISKQKYPNYSKLYLYIFDINLIKFYSKFGFQIDVNYSDSMNRKRLSLIINKNNYLRYIIIIILLFILLIIIWKMRLL